MIGEELVQVAYGLLGVCSLDGALYIHDGSPFQSLEAAFLWDDQKASSCAKPADDLAIAQAY